LITNPVACRIGSTERHLENTEIIDALEETDAAPAVPETETRA
jgi:hypothetical protein